MGRRFRKARRITSAGTVMAGIGVDLWRRPSTPTEIVRDELFPPATFWIWPLGQRLERRETTATKIGPIIRPTSFMTGIEQLASYARAHPDSPLARAHATKPDYYHQYLEQDRKRAAPLALPLDDAPPLVKPDEPKPKDFHTGNSPSWKTAFKPGDEFVLNGFTFVFHRTGRRDLHLRKKRC
jgi:hypothetical protein